MMGVITPFIEYPLLVLPTWFALNFGADAYSKACGGKYETSLVGKAARLGDRIQESKLIQSKPAQSVIKGLGSVKNAGAKAVGIGRALYKDASYEEIMQRALKAYNIVKGN